MVLFCIFQNDIYLVDIFDFITQKSTSTIGPVFCRICRPIFILVEMNISTVISELVGIVRMRQYNSRPVEWITKEKSLFSEYFIIKVDKNMLTNRRVSIFQMPHVYQTTDMELLSFKPIITKGNLYATIF